MTDKKTEAQADVQPELSQAELMAQLQSAAGKGDWKTVTTISRKIDTMVKATEKAELGTKRQALDAISEQVKVAITDAVEPFVNSGQLDAADGIWYANDFGERAATLRLMKSAAKARTGGGGTGKKFDVSTDAMLDKFGDQAYKETGMTFQEAQDSNTDKNWRYAIRKELLKLEGII